MLIQMTVEIALVLTGSHLTLLSETRLLVRTVLLPVLSLISLIHLLKFVLFFPLFLLKKLINFKNIFAQIFKHFLQKKIEKKHIKND
jgi:hypothetical protein